MRSRAGTEAIEGAEERSDETGSTGGVERRGRATGSTDGVDRRARPTGNSSAYGWVMSTNSASGSCSSPTSK